MENYLTFDLEYWYDSEFISQQHKEDFVIEGLNQITKILDKHKTKATFFVVGEILDKYPEAVKKLHEQGHEIASHSYEHKMINKLNKKEIERQIKLSKKAIEKHIGIKPLGFRAPSFSIQEKDFWIYELLDKHGFKYSSSLYPLNMRLYGSFKFPTNTFKPLKNSKILEFPIRPFNKKLRIPSSGGFMFRLFPRQMIKFFTNRLNKQGKRLVFYLHPWEFCPDLPKVKTSLAGKLVTYWGLKWNKSKLDYILSNFKFIPIKEGLKNERL